MCRGVVVAKPKKKPDPEGIDTIAENRRARHDYAIVETFEAGLELLGTEVKSLRGRHVSFTDAYAIVKDGEMWLLGLKIEPYHHGTHENHERDRTRKLLLHRAEIDKLQRLMSERGNTLVPLKLYFKHGWAKVLIGVGKGKTDVDKRQDLKRRDADREVARVLRRG
jgi:SsrA-binding protein